MNNTEAAWYLAAMIDGEGCVFYNPKTSGMQRWVSITNTDLTILSAVKKALKMLGINYRISVSKNNETTRHRTAYTFFISRKTELEKVQALIPIQCGRKREKLDRVIESYKYRRVVTKKDDLEYLYNELGLSCLEIGKKLGIDQSNVFRRLKRYGVITRTLKAARNLRETKNGN